MISANSSPPMRASTSEARRRYFGEAAQHIVTRVVAMVYSPVRWARCKVLPYQGHGDTAVQAARQAIVGGQIFHFPGATL
ncbi:MAG: hypothetical protein KA194_11255 [Alcaligenes sp.]|nr:hypothetical protein [Alcaligenes sp.]